MVQVTITNKPVRELRAEGYVFFVSPDGGHHDPTSAEVALSRAVIPADVQVPTDIGALLKKTGWRAGSGTVGEVMGLRDGKPVYLFYVGLAAASVDKADRIEFYRCGIAKIVRLCERLKITQLALDLPDPVLLGVDECDCGKETVATIIMASYQFNQFITDPARHLPQEYELTLSVSEPLHEALQVGVEYGQRIGHAVNQARQWCDLPADTLTPVEFGKCIQSVVHGHDGLTCQLFNRKEIEALGMEGLAGVAKGSQHEPRFVVIEYASPHPNAPRIGLVGKGVTFDSGGLSIKPSACMDEMKDDMAGAAAVAATMQAIAHLKPHVNVVACMAIAENLPSGTAMKPGDILRHYNGVTSEVKNTDAEGRLIIADALAYIVDKYKLNALVDLATLTGACSHALGPFFAGIMTKNHGLQEQLLRAGRTSGDWLWPLPFHDNYKPAVASDVADVCNIGKSQYRAGAITAGFFLEHFVGDVPWAHLDIAGVSFNVPDKAYFRPGATGFGVRLLIELLMRWHHENGNTIEKRG
jgi:leucyl aminopeptidase